MKKKDIFIIAGAVLAGVIIEASAVIGGLAFVFVGHENRLFDKYDYSSDKYNRMAAEVELMPKTTEIGSSEKVFTQYYFKNMFMFYSDAYTLIAKYSESDYEKEKNNMLNKYTYQTKDVKSEFINKKIKPDFSIDGFEFKTIAFDAYDELEFPKYMCFTGCNDSTKELVYIYYRDTDLDFIETQFDGFLKDDCGWNLQKFNQITG